MRTTFGYYCSFNVNYEFHIILSKNIQNQMDSNDAKVRLFVEYYIVRFGISYFRYVRPSAYVDKKLIEKR